MEKLIYLIANGLFVPIIKEENTTYAFTFSKDERAIIFSIESGQTRDKHIFHFAEKNEMEQLKKLIALPSIRNFIDSSYKKCMKMDKSKKRFLDSLTRVIQSDNNISNYHKYLIQMAAIVSFNEIIRIGFHKDNTLTRFTFIEKNGKEEAHMLLFKDNKSSILNPSEFAAYIHYGLKTFRDDKIHKNQLKNLYKWCNDYNIYLEEQFNEMNLLLSNPHQKITKRSHLSKRKIKKITEAQKELIKGRHILSKDFERQYKHDRWQNEITISTITSRTGKRRRPRKNPVNNQNNQQQNIEIENEK